MAVDANVLIFERIREEIAAGQRPQAAINSGYEKALSSIADANITTLIAAIVLFAFGTGPIKGFAITSVARHRHVDVHGDHRHPGDRQSRVRRQKRTSSPYRCNPMRLIKAKDQHQFPRRVAPAHRARSLSVILIVASIVSLSTRGLDFGIDFTGGVLHRRRSIRRRPISRPSVAISQRRVTTMRTRAAVRRGD